MTDHVIEINHGVPLVLYDSFCVFQASPDDPTARDLAVVMFETATLRSGYILADSAGFADRVDRMLRLSMDISLDEQVSLCHSCVYLFLLVIKFVE
jgi:heat shock protein beta